MFFWKFTRSGKYSNKYISLILDFHSSMINNGFLNLSYEECKNILILIQDVETINGYTNNTAGLLKSSYRSVVNQLNYDTTNEYTESRLQRGLVIGKMVLGNHNGNSLDYGKDINENKNINLDITKLDVKMNVNAKSGLVYGTEDKLKAYRREEEFIDSGYYFDLMPIHRCIIEIINKMLEYDALQTECFLINILKWKKL